MNNPVSSEIAFYLDLLFFLIFLAVSCALYFLFRLAIGKYLISKEKIAAAFLSKLNLPAVLLIVAFIFKIKAIKEALPLSQKFYSYLNAAIIFFIAFFLIRLFDAFLFSWYSRRHVPFPLPRVLHGLVLAVIYLVIVFVILKSILGINITPFLATSAILTMILGLAFQGVLNNILSGMSLHLIKSFHSGDWVKIGPNEGIVMDTNWRETRILDRFSNIIVIPNNVVASETITNFSQPDPKTAIAIPVKASYEAPPLSVLEALLEAAREVPEVLTSPSPQAYIISYDDFGISYILKFWITDFNRKHPITGDVGRLIWYKFKRRNIEIPVPLSDKVAEILETVREKEGILAGEEERDRTFLDLLHSSFLRYQEGERAGELLVPENEIREFASVLRREKYARGEIIFRQGEKGESCYIVAEGMIKGEIVYEEKGKEYKSEFRVGPGGIFGEMSLFIGMPRTATGTIEEESELLEIKAKDFALLLSRNPKLSEVVAEIVCTRNQKNEEFLRKIKELSEKDVKESCNKKSILERLKKFVLLLRK
jgi:small-conductance mechanosensitive channel/CRP-like cAMP-binding protein